MTWLRSALPAALGALLGCAVGVAASRSEAPAATPRAELNAQRVQAPVTEDAEAEMASLAARVRSLEQRVSLLTAALSAQRGAAPGAAEGELQAADVADPVFEAAVRDILDRTGEEQRQERIEQAQRRAGRGAERASERLTQELGLTEHQQQELFQVFKKHYENMAALRDENAEDRPATPGEWRARVAELRHKAQAELEGALAPQQLDKYRSLDASEFWGGPRRRSTARQE